MSKWAVVKNGVVVNIVLWDGENDWEPEDGQIAVPIPPPVDNEQEAGIGWSYSDGTFIAPPEPEEAKQSDSQG